jgi:hypothetical protein
MKISRRHLLHTAAATALLPLWLRHATYAAASSPLVSLRTGRVAGYFDQGIAVFKGIRAELNFR